MVLHFFVSYGLLFISCGFAGALGSWPERLASLAIFIAVIATAAAHVVIDDVYATPAYLTLTIDLALLATLTLIALKADRFWPIPMAAFHLLAVIGHVLRIVNPEVPPLIYKILVAAPIYPMFGILIWGTLRESRRRVGKRLRSFEWMFPSTFVVFQRNKRQN